MAFKKRCLMAQGGPPPAGPYSHAVAAGPFLFLSGQVPAKPDGSGILRGTIEEETRQVLNNVKTVLEECGSGLEHVVKVLVFLQDMDDFAKFNVAYKEFFSSDPPARSCVQAGRLPADVKVEIECIALLPDA